MLILMLRKGSEDFVTERLCYESALPDDVILKYWCLKPACPWVWAPCLLPPLIKLEWNYLFLLWEPNIERITFNKKIPFGIQNYIQGALKCLFRFHGVNMDEIRNWHLEPVTRPWSFMDRPLGYKSWSISWSQLFCIQKRYVYLFFWLSE